MSKYNEMIAALQAKFEEKVGLLEQRSLEVRSLTEQVHQLKRAVEAIRAVAEGEEGVPEGSRLSPALALPKRVLSLMDFEQARRNEIAHGTVREKVLAILRSQTTPITRAEVVERMRFIDENVNDSTVASTLSKLVGHGVGKTADNGYFVVPENDEGSGAGTPDPSE